MAARIPQRRNSAKLQSLESAIIRPVKDSRNCAALTRLFDRGGFFLNSHSTFLLDFIHSYLYISAVGTIFNQKVGQKSKLGRLGSHLHSLGINIYPEINSACAWRGRASRNLIRY